MYQCAIGMNCARNRSEAVVNACLDRMILQVVVLRNAVYLGFHIAEALEIIFGLDRDRAGNCLLNTCANQCATFPARSGSGCILGLEFGYAITRGTVNKGLVKRIADLAFCIAVPRLLKAATVTDTVFGFAKLPSSSPPKTTLPLCMFLPTTAPPRSQCGW